MSFLDFFDPVLKILPEVKAPEQKPNLKTRLLWTALVLVLFFVMGEILLIGVDLDRSLGGQGLETVQTLLASHIGTLLTLGIGPIVLASIILQLMIGGKLIPLDLTNPKDRAKFSGFQKLLAIVLSFFEALAFTGFAGLFPSLLVPLPGFGLILMLQVALGAILIIYLDEVVSKYGIGSGIGLFIAAGVAGSFFWQVFSPPEIGRAVLFNIFSWISTGQISLALPLIIALLFAVVILLVVVFAEGMHVNIPVALGTKAMGGRFPVKFLYVSNMPVILASALFANIQIVSTIVGSSGIFGEIVSRIAWATSVPRIGSFGLVEGIIFQGLSSAVLIEILHAFVYIGILVVLAVVFGKFWVELGGQSTSAVADQLQKSGMYIPGFRRDPRIIKSVLNRYIPPITILGSIFVGLLAGFSDIITGTLVSGIGILLTVGIVYRMYEELARQQVSDMHPLLKKFLG